MIVSSYGPMGFNIKCQHCKTVYGMACVAEYYLLIWIMISIGIAFWAMMLLAPFQTSPDLGLLASFKENIPSIIVYMIVCPLVYFGLPFGWGYIMLYRTNCPACGNPLRTFGKH